MSRSKDGKDNLPMAPPSQITAKERYVKPAVRHERLFETRALSCGKVQTTQSQCAHNKKS